MTFDFLNAVGGFIDEMNRPAIMHHYQYTHTPTIHHIVPIVNGSIDPADFHVNRILSRPIQPNQLVFKPSSCVIVTTCTWLLCQAHEKRRKLHLCVCCLQSLFVRCRILFFIFYVLQVCVCKKVQFERICMGQMNLWHELNESSVNESSE